MKCVDCQVPLGYCKGPLNCVRPAYMAGRLAGRTEISNQGSAIKVIDNLIEAMRLAGTRAMVFHRAAKTILQDYQKLNQSPPKPLCCPNSNCRKNFCPFYDQQEVIDVYRRS